MSLTAIDFLCGGGGSSTGLVESGIELLLGVNHWSVALATHAANHPKADHLLTDVSDMRMRYLPKADLLWASIICTEISPAGGRRRQSEPDDQMSLFDENEDGFKTLPKEAFERTRATAWCVVRAAEARRFKAIAIENVIEFATDWQLFRAWLAAMEELGYQHQITSVSSAHIGDERNEPAPQWRDRLYIVFTPKGARRVDLTPRPKAWCFDCGEDVHAFQSWRNPKATIGKYGVQYDYRCPNSRCRHAIVEPYVRPAATAIDWTNLGTRIGDRKKPLAATTMARIQAGLELYPHQPSGLTLTHGKDGTARAFDPAARPLPARSTKQGEGLLVPAGGSWNNTSARSDAPFRARTTRESEALVALPEPYIVEYRNHATASPVSNPLSAVTAQGRHHALVVPGGRTDEPHSNTLVIPYRKAAAKTAGHPFHTLSTKASAALVQSAPRIEDCRFRMLSPGEQFAAQRFPASYIRYGTEAEQTMLGGNAVSVNAAHWIGRQIQAALG
ncbi:DNA cytosine methyltransferase [Kitasatospora sp. MBT63]|uniref:DNA cytosine methyltransferase n=1 Tax=Kitasatospora sp. MBT63 TaxID=1444768 RepID=UPI00053A85AC|nr:DNA cytosine methyltransferase [Kitasatospora sp. MBT63]